MTTYLEVVTAGNLVIYANPVLVMANVLSYCLAAYVARRAQPSVVGIERRFAGPRTTAVACKAGQSLWELNRVGRIYVDA